MGIIAVDITSGRRIDQANGDFTFVLPPKPKRHLPGIQPLFVGGVPETAKRKGS
jgi:hypothetical protein